MENKGAKVAVVIFMILAVIGFTLGTVMAVPLLSGPTGETAQQQAGQAIAVIILIAPFLLSYILFALFDLITFFISIHLIKNDSKGMGVFNLLLGLAMMIAAVVICVMFFSSH